VLICDGNGKWEPGCGDGQVIAQEASPSSMQRYSPFYDIPLILSRMANVTGRDSEPHIWMPAPRFAKSGLSPIAELFGQRHHNGTGWISLVPFNTSTGLIREHAMQLNSTVDCEKVSRDTYPQTCGGADAFTANFTRFGMNFRVCAPREKSEPPWQPNRDRQDLAEELFLDYRTIVNITDEYVTINNQHAPPMADFTLRCTARTSRGYFELPNVHIGHSNSRLLDKWPSVDEMEKFHDYEDNRGSVVMGRKYVSSFSPPYLASSETQH
jgi:hypothetical protein